MSAVSPNKTVGWMQLRERKDLLEIKVVRLKPEPSLTSLLLPPPPSPGPKKCLALGGCGIVALRLPQGAAGDRWAACPMKVAGQGSDAQDQPEVPGCWPGLGTSRPRQNSGL